MAHKHIAGPWSCVPSIPEEGVECFWIENGVQHITAVDGPQNEEREATARLIAAAPELLEALEQIERLSRTADAKLVDVRAMLGDIARAASPKHEVNRYEEKLTEWFAPDAKPMREGVYELDWEDTDGRCFCKWLGSGWGNAKWVGLSGNGSIEMAIIKADRSEIYSDMAVRWRGLAEEPK